MLAGDGDTVDLKIHLKVFLKAMPDSTIEIINGREGRRRWGVEEKPRIVAETYEPNATVGAVAARHDVQVLHNAAERLPRRCVCPPKRA